MQTRLAINAVVLVLSTGVSVQTARPAHWPHSYARARELLLQGARNARRARVYARHARKTPTRSGGAGKL
jgi:hypothetical protein